MKPRLKVVLASKSPRRKQILEWAAIPFDVIAEDVPEDIPPGLPVEQVPEYLASQKSNAISRHVSLHDTLVIAADTVVVLNNIVYSKPAHRSDAIRILHELSGRMHQVITGVSLQWQQKHVTFHEVTKVWFSPLTSQEIEFYVDTYAPYDKAGAYAIQEWIGVTTIQKVEGCFFNVMGLPMNRLYHEMKQLGLMC
jgi:septum formation protein